MWKERRAGIRRVRKAHKNKRGQGGQARVTCFREVRSRKVGLG